MTTTSIWAQLAEIHIGTVVSWIIVIGAIVGAISGVTVKLYKVFTKYQKLKDDNEKQAETLRQHDETIREIKDMLSDIKSSLDEQKKVNLEQVRFNIVHTCEDAIAQEYITIGKLKSLEEMFEEYTKVFHANGYVKTLVMKTRQLPVMGKLDE